MLNTLKEQQKNVTLKKAETNEPHIKWKASPKHYTLNIDGSCLSNGHVVAGAIIKTTMGFYES